MKKLILFSFPFFTMFFQYCSKQEKDAIHQEILDDNIIVETPAKASWIIGDTVTINWHTSNNLTGVYSIYLYHEGANNRTIEQSKETANSSNQTKFFVGTDLTPGDNYKIKIVYSESHLNYSGEFSIKYGELSLISPDNSTSWFMNEPATIKWKTALRTGNVSISLFQLDPPNSSFEISNSTPNNGTYPYNVPNNMSLGGAWRIKITLDDTHSCESELFGILKRIYVTPSYSLLKRGNSYQISWSPTFYSLATNEIYLENANGNWIILKSLTGSTSQCTITIPDDITPVPDNNWRIKVSCWDYCNIHCAELAEGVTSSFRIE